MQDQEIIDLIDDLQEVGLFSRTPKDLFKFLAETRGTLWDDYVTIRRDLAKEGPELYFDAAGLEIPEFMNKYREAIGEIWTNRKDKNRKDKNMEEARSFGLSYTMGYLSTEVHLYIGVRLGGA